MQMYSKIILCTLLAHIVGDYYFQTSKTVEEKFKNYKVLFLHAVIYCIPFLALYLFSNKNPMFFKFIIYLCLSHFIIDFFKAWISSSTKIRTKYQNKYWTGEAVIYLSDQFLHIGLILGFSICFVNRGLTLQPMKLFEIIAKDMGISIDNTIKWILLILLIYKPANITFSKLFKLYKPVEDISSKTITGENGIKAGAMIGFLERVLLIIFFSIEQYSSIALVMTAKSIARYERLSKEENFAEYYLIGTLSSMIMAITAYYLVFKIL